MTNAPIKRLQEISKKIQIFSKLAIQAVNLLFLFYILPIYYCKLHDNQF